MKKPCGFGKNYFTLSAILAYSVQNRLQSQVTSAYSLIKSNSVFDEEILSDIDDPPDLLASALILAPKASL